MGLSEYLAARNYLISMGQPIITYILIISLFQCLFAILCLMKKEKYHDILKKCLYINTGLYCLGFIFLIWFHYQIYDTALIEYPAVMQQMIPATESRFVIPLWIEAEKLYFWAMITSIFVLLIKKQKDLFFALSIVLSFFSILIYFVSNPFHDPLPIVHGEVTNWYAVLGSGDGRIFALSGSMYGRITYFYNSTYMWVHPPMLFISYASLVITAIACVHMLFKNDRVYDEIAYKFAKFGYILLTAGMLIGYPWAIEAWKDSAWWWDPKISGSIMMWALYSAYLHARIYAKKGKMWTATAWLGIICFASLIFTYLLTYIVPGIHSVVQP